MTLLFADVRGFSRISERLGPAGTVNWINDIMGALSTCVLDHQGVLVDYIGDELIAMWGAPKEAPDHARRACRAALDMLAKLPELNERWRSTLKEPMGLGIGINTGVAQVGNTGSAYKFKYGALDAWVLPGIARVLGERVAAEGKADLVREGIQAMLASVRSYEPPRIYPYE